MKRGQRSPGMYAWPKPKSSPLPEYSIELRFVAPMAFATAAIPVLCCAQPTIDIVIAMPAIIPLSIFQSSFNKGISVKLALGHLLGLGFVLVRDVELDRAGRKFCEVLVAVNGAARDVNKIAGLHKPRL